MKEKRKTFDLWFFRNKKLAKLNSTDIELNTQGEIPYLRVPIYYSYVQESSPLHLTYEFIISRG